MPVAIVGTAFIGYIYDIFGRRLTLFLSFFLGSILIALVPWTSPYVVPWLLVLRALIQLCLCAPAASPLTADYIHKDSVGKGVAMQGIGVVIGEVISMGILFRVTANFEPWLAFATVGAVGLVISFFFLFMVKEPKLRVKV
jgi:MFS family permease